MMWGYYYGPMHFFGGLAMVLWWILVVWAVIAFIKWVRRGATRRMFYADPALDLLRERFAKGEIDKKEFEERKAELIK